MKKIALTLVGVAFGTCMAFAQTTPQPQHSDADDAVHTLQFDRMSNSFDEEEEEERMVLSVDDLPETVIEQLKYSELAGHTILSVTQVQSRSFDENEIQYELVLQDETGGASATEEPTLVVRYDEFGELLTQKETAAPVTIKKKQ